MTVKRTIQPIILAAGKSTRMRSDQPKVLHHIAQQPMLEYVLKLINKASANLKDISFAQTIVVANNRLSENKEYIQLQSRYKFKQAIQGEISGTYGAVSSAMPMVSNNTHEILILYGDTPFLTAESITKMIRRHANTSYEVVCAGFQSNRHDNEYGILMCDNGTVGNIIEHKHIQNTQKNSETIYNSGVMLISYNCITNFHDYALRQLSAPHSEVYLTKIVEFANSTGGANCGYITIDENEAMGINNCHEKAAAERYMQATLQKAMMDNGVSIIDPRSTYISADTQIDTDVTIYPNVWIGKNVKIGRGSNILSFSHIEGAHIDDYSQIGPFARIRPQSHLGKHTKIGNFVEIKNSTIAARTKAGHLTYIGDTSIDEDTNIGAGTIFCNYDGQNKHKASVGKKCFIGSNSTIISPVVIKDNVFVAAGTTVTRNIESNQFVISRVKQQHKERK